MLLIIDQSDIMVIQWFSVMILIQALGTVLCVHWDQDCYWILAYIVDAGSLLHKDHQCHSYMFNELNSLEKWKYSILIVQKML